MQCNIKRNEIHAKKNVRQADWQRAHEFIPNNRTGWKLSAAN